AGVNLHIDTLLFHRPWGDVAATRPGRMGPPASVCLTLLGIALFVARPGSRAGSAAPAAGLAVVFVSFLSITGYLFGADQLFTIPRLTGIALQTSTILLALGLGVLAAVPERAPVRLLLDEGAAGLLARRALPFIILAPLALGWLRLEGQRQDVLD